MRSSNYLNKVFCRTLIGAFFCALSNNNCIKMHCLRHSRSSTLANVPFISKNLKATSWPALKIGIPHAHYQLSHMSMLTSNTCYFHSTFRGFLNKTKFAILGKQSDKAISERNIMASHEMQAFIKQTEDSSNTGMKQFSSTQSFQQFLINAKLSQNSSLQHFFNQMRKENLQINQKLVQFYILLTSQGLGLSHDVLHFYIQQKKKGRDFTQKSLQFYRLIKDQGIFVDQAVLNLYELLLVEKREPNKTVIKVFQLMRKHKIAFQTQDFIFCDFFDKNRVTPGQRQFKFIRFMKLYHRNQPTEQLMACFIEDYLQKEQEKSKTTKSYMLIFLGLLSMVIYLYGEKMNELEKIIENQRLLLQKTDEIVSLLSTFCQVMYQITQKDKKTYKSE